MVDRICYKFKTSEQELFPLLATNDILYGVCVCVFMYMYMSRGGKTCNGHAEKRKTKCQRGQSYGFKKETILIRRRREEEEKKIRRERSKTVWTESQLKHQRRRRPINAQTRSHVPNSGLWFPAYACKPFITVDGGGPQVVASTEVKSPVSSPLVPVKKKSRSLPEKEEEKGDESKKMQQAS